VLFPPLVLAPLVDIALAVRTAAAAVRTAAAVVRKETRETAAAVTAALLAALPVPWFSRPQLRPFAPLLAQ